MARKLGLDATKRLALLKNQASQLLWYGKIETTEARAKDLAAYTEKILTLAINNYTDTLEEEVTVKIDGKEEKKMHVKDGVKKLAARRKIMTLVNDLQEVKGFKESKADFKKRTAEIKYPLIEKIFDEYAPKYAQRKEEKNGIGGGYTRIYKLGPRKGDAAAKAIIELID